MCAICLMELKEQLSPKEIINAGKELIIYSDKKEDIDHVLEKMIKARRQLNEESE